MQLFVSFLITLFVPTVTSTFDVVNNNDYLTTEKDDMYGSSLAKCEYYALRLGSELVDVFNAPHSNLDTSQRIYQDFIVENLGFAKWIGDGMRGKTSTNQDSHTVHGKKGWIGKGINESPYGILSHKWIYMYGDSTTRQVWASYAAPFKDNSFERNAKEWSRHYCNKQDHRKRHAKDGTFDEEGWRGPCGVNEVTCHVAGYGEQGLLTFDWKHFPYEDYDEYLFNLSGPWQAGFPGEEERRPDLFTVQFGLHTCTHANPEGPHSHHLHTPNHTMMAQHLTQIEPLVASIRKAIDFPVAVEEDNNSSSSSTTQPKNTKKRNKTHVIFLTSGMSGQGSKGILTDACIQTMNSKLSEVAHRYGFAVLERGEIERRLMFRSSFSANPLLPIGDSHLIQPAQNIIATSLLHLYSCLDHFNVSQSRNNMKMKTANDEEYPLPEQPNFRNWGQTPQHNPPA